MKMKTLQRFICGRSLDGRESRLSWMLSYRLTINTRFLLDFGKLTAKMRELDMFVDG
jgi:hypothetical protein